MLFFYFVGHGKVSRYQELCLILTDSDFDNPDLTGLEFGRVRRVVEESQARVKIVILDCCYSNRALSGPAEVLSAVEVSEIVEITGTYTLVATNPASKLARVSALAGEHDNTATAFTRELLELIYEGRPGSSPYLTLRDIHDPLLSRLSALSLPTSSRNVTDTADRFPFVRNVAYGTAGTQPADRPRLAIPPRPRPSQWRRMTQRVSRRDLIMGAGAVVIGAAGGVAALWPDNSPAPAHRPGKPVAALLGTAETSHTAGVWQVAAGQLGQRPVAVSSGADHQILLWDLAHRRRA